MIEIKPFELKDKVTGNHIRLTVSDQYLVFKVNERDYFISLNDGKFEGTGSDLTYIQPK